MQDACSSVSHTFTLLRGGETPLNPQNYTPILTMFFYPIRGISIYAVNLEAKMVPFEIMVKFCFFEKSFLT